MTSLQLPLTFDKSKLPFIHIGVLAIFIFISYYPSLDVPFVFDDMPNIVFNPAVHPENVSELGRSFHSDVSENRTLAMFSFAINYLVGGLDVFGYHLVNTIIHLVNAILLYFICLKLLTKVDQEKRGGYENADWAVMAFFAAALWALNPVQTQAVTYIVQRMTSMATFFYLTGLLIFICFRFAKLSGSFALPLMLLSFLAGMACKEIVVTMPLAFLLIEIFFNKDADFKTLKWFVVAGVFFVLAIGTFYLQSNFPDWSNRYVNRNFSPMERVMTQWRVLWHYLGLFILPLPERLHLTYDYPVSRGLLQPWTTFAGLLALSGLLAGAWKIHLRRPIAAFGIFFFFTASAVEASFVNLELAFIHRIYLPSVFLPLVVISYVPPSLFKRLTVVFIIITAVLSFGTISRNEGWQDTKKFWQGDLEQGGTAARSLNNQAAALIDAGNFSAAIELLKKVEPHIETFEDHRIMLYNSGFAHFYEGNLENALRNFSALTEKYGGYKNAYLFMGKIYLAQGKFDQAAFMAEKLLGHAESRFQGEILTAMIAAEKNEYASAESILLNSLKQTSPSEVEPYMQTRLELARIYLMQKKADAAYRIFLEITQRFPQNYSAWTMIYRMLKAGNDEKAAATVKKFLDANNIIVNEKSR